MMFKLDLQLFASKKGVGSTKNGRDSRSKRLGAKLGAPYVEGAAVEATVEKQGKEKKVVIYKYNPKKHYHKKQGHRQPYTKLVINTING